MNIVVLCGGTSTEREVSLWTGENVCSALRLKGHNTLLLDVFIGRDDIKPEQFFELKESIEDELVYIKEKSKDIEEQKKIRKCFFGNNVLEICMSADIVFMALHGENGENGKVQATFDLLGIKYTGADYLSSAMAMNKAVSRKIFLANNVPMANGTSLYAGEECLSAKDLNLNYPVVVKPSCGGSSIGVFFANNDSEFKNALKNAFEYENELVIEEKIMGREFSCGVVKYEAYPVIEIIPKVGEYDFKNKYEAGATDEICPANISMELTKKIQDVAVLAAKALMLDTYCRVDVLTDAEENCYCLEANTLPGMTKTSLLPQEAATIGIDFPSLCENLINISLSDRK